MARPGKGLVLGLALAASGLALLGLGLGLADRWNAPAPVPEVTAAPAIAAPAPADDPAAPRTYLAAADAERGYRQGLLPAGTRSVLNLRETMQYGDFHWNDDGVPPGELTVRVDVRRQLVSVYRAGHEIGAAVALYGEDGKETPLGQFPILRKSEDYRSRTYDAPMPYSLWLTNDGVAMHGSSVREGRATNGCVGVPIGFARLVFEQAEVGDIVEVVRTDKNIAAADAPERQRS